MSKIMRWMMEIEHFCDGYFFDAPIPNDFTVDEVLEDVEAYFKSKEASEYAKNYLLSTL